LVIRKKWPLLQKWGRITDSEGCLETLHMARYHFHLWDGTCLIHDPEGADLNTMRAVEERAVQVARELLAEEIVEG
jgi:hypothetical protein